MKSELRKGSTPWKGVSWRKVTRTVDRRDPGIYEIRELLREFWPWEKRRSWYGQVFKSMVATGAFSRLRWVGEKSNGHQLYEVLEPKGEEVPGVPGNLRRSGSEDRGARRPITCPE